MLCLHCKCMTLCYSGSVVNNNEYPNSKHQLLGYTYLALEVTAVLN